MRTAVTDLQRKVYAAAAKWIKAHGRGPTMGDLADLLGYGDRITCMAAPLQSLKKRGVLTWEPGDYTTMRILDAIDGGKKSAGKKEPLPGDDESDREDVRPDDDDDQDEDEDTDEDDDDSPELVEVKPAHRARAGRETARAEPKKKRGPKVARKPKRATPAKPARAKKPKPTRVSHGRPSTASSVRESARASLEALRAHYLAELERVDALLEGLS